MRFSLIIACLSVVWFALPSWSNSFAPPATHVVRWDGPQSRDFESIKQGVPVQHVFKFTNISKDTIILQTVRTTCGCTAAKWTEAPIPPGETGEVGVEYDAYNWGSFKKKIMVFFDKQRKPELLYIRGQVE